MTSNTQRHFNNIAKSYKDEIPLHTRDHLINRLWNFCSPYFFYGCKVIDIGCGDGTNSAFFKAKGIDIVGVDFSEKLIQQGNKLYPQLKNRLCVGDCLNLQFTNRTFDIAVMIGVLHHINSREKQIKAVQEALRLLKNEGILIIRESNLLNPLFRIFWNYIFPLTAKIDRFGGENWISARYLSEIFHDLLVETIYFTFIPNFTPKSLLPLAGKAEKFLEQSIVKKQSAHYITIIKRHE